MKYDETERFENIKAVISNRIMAFLFLSGMSKVDLAKKANMGRSDIWRIMNEKSNLTLSTITKIETAMNETELFLLPIKSAPKKEATDAYRAESTVVKPAIKEYGGEDETIL